MNYCSNCGHSPLDYKCPEGDIHQRFICGNCEVIHYQNPKMVCGALAFWEGKVLLCKRDIEPCKGKWNLPAGYMENNETLAQGAARELREESGVVIPPEQLALYMTGTITFINQIYIAFRGTVDTEFYLPGVESQNCGFFTRQECPWDKVAYPEVNDSIVQAYDDLDSGKFQVWQAEMSENRYELHSVVTRVP